MLFIETSFFTKQIKELLTDDEYRLLQEELIIQPDKGNLIKHGGGIRKIRHGQQAKGKSGGIRAIYYWIDRENKIYFLLAYPKSSQDNLTDQQIAILRKLVKEEL